MFVTWDPEDGSTPRVWEFKEDDVLKSEAIAIEKAMGGPQASYEMWFAQMRSGNMKARGILLWHLMRQEHRGLKYEDTPDFRKRQLKVEMSVVELRELKAQMGSTKMDEATKEMFDAQFDRDIRAAMERETGVVEGDITDGVGNEVAVPKA